jgi:hypothetical protein
MVRREVPKTVAGIRLTRFQSYMLISRAEAVMNKVVRHYPVNRLPAELQAGLPMHGTVKIEFQPETEAGEPVLLAPLAGSCANIHGTEEDVLRYIRELREDR